MLQAAAAKPARPILYGAGPGFAEFVTLMALLMALNALAIDAMLPALPAIGDDLGVADHNRRQLVITVYVLGFGATQMLYGPLADRLGRKPVLAAGLGLYALFAGVAAAAPSFELLLLARFFGGAAASAPGVLVVSMVRDRFEGAAMARVMSLTFVVFMAVPVIAPTLGSAILLAGPWRLIFGLLGAAGLVMLAWFVSRMPETLDPANRRGFNAREIWAAARTVLTTRQSLGYTLASTAMFGGLMGFITSVQQVVADAFGRPDALPWVFAAIAGPIAVTSWLNSRLVERRGVKRLAHMGLFAYLGFAALHLLSALRGESLVVFIVLQGLTMAGFGLASSNFRTLAMQPLGAIAGTASSVQGTISTIGGALLGTAIGQSFDGTTVPMLAGFTVLGAVALGLVMWTERGQLLGRDGR